MEQLFYEDSSGNIVEYTEEMYSQYLIDQEEAERGKVPKRVSMRQARLALLEMGMLQTVADAINNGSDEALKIEWEYATDVERNWSRLITLSELLGITSEDLDSLFVLAGSK